MLRTLSAILLPFCFLTAVADSASVENTLPGQTRIIVHTGPDWDKFTATPDASLQEWFRDHIWRMSVYAPFFDPRLSWYPNALVYSDLYAIPVDSPFVEDHPDWILKDAAGQNVYIPVQCRGGACRLYAADLSKAPFRHWWIERAQRYGKAGYKGIWIDDVNLTMRVSDGTGKFQQPVRAGKPITEEMWRGDIANFLEEIRRSLPAMELVGNIRWSPDDLQLANGGAASRVVSALNFLNVEDGLTKLLLSAIDRIHSSGKGVVLDNRGNDVPTALATYFMISSGRDAFSLSDPRPNAWPNALSADLGMSLGPPQVWNRLLVRRFTGGLAVFNPPGSAPLQVKFARHLHTLGVPRSKDYQLDGSRGLVASGKVSASASLDSMLTARAPR